MIISCDDGSHGGSCEEWDQAVEQLERAATPPVSKVSRVRRGQTVCRATLRPTQNVEPKVSHSGETTTSLTYICNVQSVERQVDHRKVKWLTLYLCGL